MKKKLSIKKYVNVVIVLIVIFLIGFFSINYVLNNNEDFNKDLVKEVDSNYKSNSKLESVNVYGGYYIAIYVDKVVVLDREYKEVYKEDRSKLSNNEKNYDIIYKTNKLMYEETVLKGDKVIYNYYDIHNYEYINSITLK